MWKSYCLGLMWWMSGCSDAVMAQAPTAPSHSNSTVIVAMGLVDVEQSVARLLLEMPGRVKSIEAKENVVYEPGAVLLAVDDTGPRIKLAQLAVAIEAAKAKVEQARLGRVIAEAEVKAQQTAIDAAIEREKTYLRRQKEVKDIDQVPKATIREIEDAVRESGAIIKGEREKLKVIEAKVAYARSEEALAVVQVKAQETQLREAQKAVDDCVLRAPFKGRVLRVKARLGELVSPAMLEPLIEFCPEAPRIVRAEINQEFAHSAQIGQVCKITDDSRTASGSWSGKIVRLSDWYAPRRSILFEPLQMNDVRTLECIVAFDPGQFPLKIGQRVRLSIETTSAPVVSSPGEAKETGKK